MHISPCDTFHAKRSIISSLPADKKTLLADTHSSESLYSSKSKSLVDKMERASATS